MSDLASTPDAHTGEAIARAEHRRAVLERLTELGMVLAETITARAVDISDLAAPQRDPGRSFASVSRSVRLTLVLEGRIDKDIIAMRNGVVVPIAAAAATNSSAAVAITSAEPVAVDAPSCARLARVRGAVWEAINREVRGLEEASEALDRLHESLIEREDYEGVLYRPWREAVAAICSDLGLDPDWSRWSDEDGFVRPPGTSGYLWQSLWKYSPQRAEERRRRRCGDTGKAPPRPDP